MKMQGLGKAVGDFTDREKEVFKIYTRLNKANKHKMIPIPICKKTSKYSINDSIIIISKEKAETSDTDL